MKRRILFTAIVAAVMGAASPSYAQSWPSINEYMYFENGQLVGMAQDDCTSSGVVAQGQWLWGHATADVHVGRLAYCVRGQWVM